MKYKVTFIHNHVGKGSTVITADSPEAAEEQAKELDVEDIEDWEGLHGELYVDSVTQIENELAQQGRTGK